MFSGHSHQASKAKNTENNTRSETRTTTQWRQIASSNSFGVSGYFIKAHKTQSSTAWRFSEIFDRGSKFLYVITICYSIKKYQQWNYIGIHCWWHGLHSVFISGKVPFCILYSWTSVSSIDFFLLFICICTWSLFFRGHDVFSLFVPFNHVFVYENCPDVRARCIKHGL